MVNVIKIKFQTVSFTDLVHTLVVWIEKIILSSQIWAQITEIEWVGKLVVLFKK